MTDGAVLVDLRSNQVFELNETGARIRELQDQGLSTPEIAARLTAEFDVDEDTAVAEVERVSARLAEADLLA